jgi:hypothetical protein
MVDDELKGEKRALESRAAEIEDALGIRPRVRIAVGDPAASLIEAAEEAAPESAYCRGESRSGCGAAIAGRERLDQGLEGFQGAGSNC